LGTSAIDTTSAAIYCRSRGRIVIGTHECFVGFELRLELFFSEGSILDLGPLSLGLRDGSSRKTEFNFFPALVICDIRCGNTFHPENLDFITITARQRIVDAWQVVWLKFMYLLDMHG
jgi:hypothetical protein